MTTSNSSPIAKVLVIDDNKGILFSIQQALKLKGYEVSTSETFDDVEAVEKIAPDLLYLDVSLVGKDGREVSRELKADPRTKHICIIILTAYPNADELAKEAGADDFLPKPFDLAELWKMTEKYTQDAHAGVPPSISAAMPLPPISKLGAL